MSKGASCESNVDKDEGGGDENKPANLLGEFSSSIYSKSVPPRSADSSSSSSSSSTVSQLVPTRSFHSAMPSSSCSPNTGNSFTSVRTQSAPNSPQSCSAESDAASFSSSSNSEYSSPEGGFNHHQRRRTKQEDDSNFDVSLLTKGFTKLRSPRAGSVGSDSDVPMMHRFRGIAVDRVNENKVARRRSEDRNVHQGRPTTAPMVGFVEDVEEEDDEEEGVSASKKGLLKSSKSFVTGSTGTSAAFGGGFGQTTKVTPPPMIFTGLPPKVKSPDGTPESSFSSLACTPSFTTTTPSVSSTSSASTADSGISNSLKRRRPGLRSDLHLSLDTLASPEEPNGEKGLGLETPRVGKSESEAVSVILPWLFLGSLNAIQKSPAVVKMLGFTHFVNASRSSIPEMPDGVSELTLYLRDKSSQDISSVFFQAVQFIEEAKKTGGRVLVFCQRGISRSATIVLAYLIWREKLSYEEAFAMLKEIRPQISPNVGFCLQLMSWASLRPSVVPTSRTLVYRIAASDCRSGLTSSSPGTHAKPVAAPDEEDDHIEKCQAGTELIALACGPVQEIVPAMFDAPCDDAQPLHQDFDVATRDTSSRCWLVCSHDAQYIWSDANSPQWLIGSALTVASQLTELEGASHNVIQVPQGKEPPAFWDAIHLAQNSTQ